MKTDFKEYLTYDDVLLVPQFSEIATRSDVDLSISLHKNLKLSLPIIPANMDTVAEGNMAIALGKLGGFVYIHRFLTIDEQVKEVKKAKKKGFMVGASIGVKPEDEQRLKSLLNAGIDSVLLDIAHGHSKLAGDMCKKIKKATKLPVAAGNVATAEGVAYLVSCGADIVKVGVGPGSVCTTRIMTGSGVPQFSAVLNCAREAKKTKTPIIADGGIKNSGDIVKALAAGANAVMAGRLFAGTNEAPGEIISYKGKKYKTYRGMASFEAQKDRPGKKGKILNSEGVKALVPYKGGVEKIIERLMGGVRSGLSYSGAQNVAELQKKAEFIRVTDATVIENYPHDVLLI